MVEAFCIDNLEYLSVAVLGDGGHFVGEEEFQKMARPLGVGHKIGLVVHAFLDEGLHNVRTAFFVLLEFAHI